MICPVSKLTVLKCAAVRRLVKVFAITTFDVGNCETPMILQIKASDLLYKIASAWQSTYPFIQRIFIQIYWVKYAITNFAFKAQNLTNR